MSESVTPPSSNIPLTDLSIKYKKENTPSSTSLKQIICALDSNDAYATIPTVFKAPSNSYHDVLCQYTLLDTGCTNLNVMNQAFADLLIAQGHSIDSTQNYELIAYDKSSQTVQNSILLDTLECCFPSGTKLETDVLFLVFPCTVGTEPEVILSNAFLRDRFQFEIIEQIDKTLFPHNYPIEQSDSSTDDVNAVTCDDITTINIIDSSVNQPLSLMLPSIDDITSLTVNIDGTDPTFSRDLQLCREVHNHVNKCKNLATSCKSVTTTMTNTDSLWSSLKNQLVTTAIAESSTTQSVNVKVDENVVSVDTTSNNYTLTRQTIVAAPSDASILSHSANLPLGLEGRNQRVTPGGTIACLISTPTEAVDSYGVVKTVQYRDATKGPRVPTPTTAKRQRILEHYSNYEAIRVVGRQLDTAETCQQRQYRYAVEVEPYKERNLNHLDPTSINLRLGPVIDNGQPLYGTNYYRVDNIRRETDLSHLYPSVLRATHFRRLKSTKQPLSNDVTSLDKVDITELFTNVQMKEYVLRLRKNKVRKFAAAARLQAPRAKITDEELNTVLIDGEDLTYLVRENMDKFQFHASDIEELDPTIQKNPKAFWFGDPETPAEAQQHIDDGITAATKELAADTNVTSENIADLRSLVTKYSKLLRTRLGNDIIAKIPPMKITLKDGCDPKKMKLYSMRPNAREQMDRSVNELETAQLIKRCLRTTWCASAQMVPKPGGAPGEMRLVIDYKWLNACTVPLQGGMPILADELRNVQGCKYFFSADFLKGFWQCLLHEDSQEYFSFITPQGVYKPMRIPQGAVDSPLYFHSQLSRIFSDLIGEKHMLLWIDDVLLFARSWEEFLSIIERFFERCKEYNLQVNIKKTTLASNKAVFCGREINGEGVRYQARNTDTFKNMQVPTEAGELSQFLMGINWMRDSILNDKAEGSFAAISAPLWDMLNTIYDAANSRKKRKYKNFKLSDYGWSTKHTEAFNKLKHKLVDDCISQSFHIPGARLCLFTDASDNYYAALLTQVVDWDPRLGPNEQKHIPMATLSGEFRGSEKNWRIIEKEAYPIIMAIQEWDHFLCHPDGFDCYVDHKNLVHIFNPASINPPLTKGAQLRVYNWLYLLGQYKVNRLQHLPGELNAWADMLSRWANPLYEARKSTPVTNINTLRAARKRQKSKRPRPSDTQLLNTFLRLNYNVGNPVTELPTRQVIAAAQQNLTATEKQFVMQNSKHFTSAPDGLMLFKEKMWIPHEQVELLTRLCIGAHCGLEPGCCEAGHRSINTTLSYLQEYVQWHDMTAFVTKFCHSCLSCLKDKASNTTIPRPLGSQIHATHRGQVVSMDYLYIEKPSVDSPHQYSYILVLKDDYSGYVELVPCSSPSSDEAATALSWWIARFKKPAYLISDQGSHFTSQVIERLSRWFNINHHFTVPYCPWSNGSVERVNRDVKALLKVILRTSKHTHADWPYALPAVMNIINQTPSERLGGYAPKQVYMGIEKYNPFNVLYAPHTKSFTEVPLNSAEIKDHVQQLQKTLEAMHKAVDIAKDKRRITQAKSRLTSRSVRQARALELGIRVQDLTDHDCIPHFSPGDYVLVARARMNNVNKLTAIWRGPYRVLRAFNNYVYEVEHLVTDEVFDVHVSRLRFYADSYLDLPVALMDELQAETSLNYEYTISQVLEHEYDQYDEEYKLKIQWDGFSELETTWEPLVQLFADQPKLIQQYIDTLPSSDIHKSALQRAVDTSNLH
jgi:transposase InsO family protein